MTDIVELLRAWAECGPNDLLEAASADLFVAADEIERLREALRDIACDCKHECADSPYMAGPVTPNCCRNFARTALKEKE